MARDEANIKVRLDTKQAKSDLRGLNKAAAGTATQIGGKVRGGIGRLAGAVGVGGLAGAAVASAKGSVFGGAGDLFSGAFGPQFQQLATAIFDGADLEALAAKQARAGLPNRLLGSQTTDAGKQRVKDAAQPMFQFNKKYYGDNLRGIRGFGSDPTFGGPGAEAVGSAVGLTKAIASKDVLQVLEAIAKDAVQSIIQALRDFKQGGGKR